MSVLSTVWWRQVWIKFWIPSKKPPQWFRSYPRWSKSTIIKIPPRQPLITKSEKSVWVINVAHVSAHQNWLLRKSKVIVLWKKSLLVFWPRPKSVTEPYCQKWAKNSILLKIGIFSTWSINKKWFFCEKNHFCFSSQVQKMSNLAEIEFLAHFWQYGSVTFFGLGQKTRSDFFHKKITLDLLSNLFWWPEK